MFNPTDTAPVAVQKYVGRAPDGTLVYEVGPIARMYYDIERRDGALSGLVQSVIDRTDAATLDVLWREFYGRLYGFAEPTETPAPHGVSWAKDLHELAGAMPEWKSLELRTGGDPWLSAIATAAIGDKLRDKLPTLPEDKRDEQAELDALRALLNRVTKNGKRKRKTKKLEEQIRKLEERVAGQAEAAKTVTDWMASPAVQSQLRVALAEGAAAATEAVGQAETALAGLGQPMGGTGAGAGSKHVPGGGRAERHAVLRANPGLARIAQLAGRILSRVQTRMPIRDAPGASEVVAVEQGSDLHRLLPSERMLFAPGVLGGLGAALAYSRLLDGSALQYEVRGNEKSQRGPMILAIDESGSMKGERQELASGVALAMMQMAAGQRRPFATIHFNGGVTGVHAFPRAAEVPLDRMVELCTRTMRGGTSISAALRRAHAMIKNGRIEHDGVVTEWKDGRRADVVLITDADVTAQDAADCLDDLEAIREAGAVVYGVQVGASAYGNETDWRDMVERWLTVDVEDVEEVADLLSEVKPEPEAAAP